ncbi:septum site-determining protein MinC [Selenihalanaerobacter shriftii]|uniref:Probable septum site-determining protein MinC n=1 Tax=Selenihalanaerobacter shriftii TaxID=142842 RepID=A0A1T4PNL3_9FIRM|nr:septum site-determining protein MinC [Selenihalanaerobacter shriftii]SJZ92921.1 septum site-determining protein MinC [Selenihalanaerobacter shriftii]
MQKDRILFKWDKGSLVIVLDEDVEFDYLIKDLKEKASKAENFFIDAKIKLDIGKRELSSKQKERLIKLFTSLPGLSVIEIVKNSLPDNPKDHKNEDEPEISTLWLDKTLRSGQSIEYDGNIIIQGDVNPGAEVVAKGDIMVMGTFRGVGHAGATGKEDATIAAFRLQPTQLRIGNKICRSPDGEIKHPNKPEIALIEGGDILIKVLKN